MRTVVLAIAVLSASLNIVKGDTCHFNIQDHLQPGKEALVLENDNGKPTGIAYPDEFKEGKGLIAVTPQRPLMLACTGKNNKLTSFPGSQTAVITCGPGKKLTIEAERKVKDVSKTSTSCSSWSHSIVEKTSQSCEHVGIVLNAVFEVPVADKTYKVPLLRMCYHEKNRTTLYSHHTISGSSLQGKVIPERKPSFTNGVKWGPPNVETAYSPKNQMEKIPPTYVDGKSKSLVRGHLAPNADFIYVPQRLSTYYYENAAPQWRKFNAEGGNWITIENAVRQLAKQLNSDVEVWTGTFGVLELPVSEKASKEIYLYVEKDVNKFPVPKVFWKLVRDPKQGICTAIIGHNNVYLTKDPPLLCQPPPTPSGWPTLHDRSKGYIQYCDYGSFLKAVPYVPSNLICKGVLGLTA